MNNVEEDIRAFLLATVSACSGRTFCGPAQDPRSDIPAEAVFVLQTGGMQPLGYMDSSDKDFRPVRIQARIRSAPHDYPGGKTLALAVQGALQRAFLGSPGYVSVLCEQASPNYWGRDDKEHHDWSVNAVVRVKD